MYLNHLRWNLQSIGLVLCLSVLLVGLTFTSPSIIHGQTEPNHTYDCGTYGAGEYGQNDCLAASDVTATPAQEELDGSLPDSGASLGWWAAVGALLIALGLGLYGYNRRQQRLNGGAS